MKPIIADSHDFRALIERGAVYVDKTGLLFDLVSGDRGSRFFISRPRRFGKSLMLSTLAALFQGEREYFKDLEITRRDYDFRPFPVIQLDMTGVLAPTAEALEQSLKVKIRELVEDFSIEINEKDYPTSGLYFGALIRALFKRDGKIVVLVDEYDAPVNGFLMQKDAMDSMRTVLHDFYVQIKSHDEKIRFIMMTGVSKLAKLSVFSGLNNLRDLTMMPEMAGLLGYTRDEILQYFGGYLDDFAKMSGVSSEQKLEELLAWYDGYRFSPRSDLKVTNPVSLGLALDNRYIRNYWESTGNAKMVYDVLKQRCVIPAELNEIAVSVSDLDAYDAGKMKTATLLYQVGYLTIGDVMQHDLLKLRLPNREVDSSVHSGLLSHLIGERASAFEEQAGRARAALWNQVGNPAGVIQRTLHAAFALIPYEWKIRNEAEAKRMFLFYCKFMGADITGEVQSCLGRADAVLKSPRAIYVFEFKYDHSSENALQQNRDAGYADPYGDDDRAVYRVGVNFNSSTRNIDDPIIEEVKSPGIGIASDESPDQEG